MQNTRSIYIEGNGNVKYFPLIHEKSENDLTVPKNVSKKITLKFTKEYNSNSAAKSLIFSSIVMDKKESSNTNKIGIKIELK